MDRLISTPTWVALTLSLAGTFATNTYAAPQTVCAFGIDVGDIASNPRFEIKRDLFSTCKLARISGMHRDLLFVQIDEIYDRQTQHKYHMNMTFLDRDDGGNTLGWIEDITASSQETVSEGDKSALGKVVAEIRDSEFYKCQIR